MTPKKKTTPSPAPTPPNPNPAAFAEAALASMHASEAPPAPPAPAPAAKTVLVPAYKEAAEEKLIAAKAAFAALLAATPNDLARVFETPEAYECYLKARAAASAHV